jgi:hypothetical protein
MAFWTGWLAKLGSAFNPAGKVEPRALALRVPGTDEVELAAGNGSGAMMVDLAAGEGLATEARQTSSSCASVAAKTAPATPAAAEATAATVAANTGVLFVADDNNGGKVYLGGAGVTTSTGVALSAGDSVFLRVSDPALVYCIGSAASQVLRIVVL